MKRLTHYYNGKVAEPRNRSEAQAMAKKLAEYEDAEEKGLLLRLPCKVGDTVYELSEGVVEECTVETIFISNYIDNNGVVSYMAELHYEREDCPYVSTEIYFTDIGKTVFLTPEAAQQALKADEKEIEPTPVEDMSFSVRTYNCLKRAGINTLQDLSTTTEQDLMKVRNLGARCFREIIEKCKLYGVDIISESEDAKIEREGK